MAIMKRLILLLLILTTAFSLFSCLDNGNAEISTSSDDVSEQDESEASSESSSQSESELTSESKQDITSEITTEGGQIEVPEPTQKIDQYISLCDYTTEDKSVDTFVGSKEYGVYFKIPDGRVKAIYFELAAVDDPCSNYLIEIYRCQESPASSRQTPKLLDEEPVYSTHITSLDFKNFLVKFEGNEICEGTYYMTITSPDYNGTYNDIIFLGKAWLSLPDEYDGFAIKTFINGSAQKKFGLYGGFIVERDVPVSSVPENNEEKITETDGEKTAKIILLSGQSNATGASVCDYLNNHYSEEKIEQYFNGYSNVQILYSAGLGKYENNQLVLKVTNSTDTFVPTSARQGVDRSRFGPELGLAEYLSETYPDEKFYIIKSAFGSVSLEGFFNVIEPGFDLSLNDLKAKIDLGIDLLEAEGLEPKIVAFLWMQGESDAVSIYKAHNYYNLQKAMVEHLREEYKEYASARGIAFIDAAISDHGFWTASMPLNAMKQNYAYESQLNYYIDTNAEGLTTLYENDDQAHYDSMSMIKLGHLFGECVSKAID